MLVQDPSCCNGALRVPDHLKLEEKFDLIIAVVLLILFFSSFLKDLLCKEKRYLFCFSNFSEVDIFGTESLRYWRKTLTNVDAILAYLYLVNRLSNLGNTYSCFKTREIRKLTICQRHTLKVLQN